jgi:sterol 3beta-glucosyltransferase
MEITLLTYGSRGDVQPYLALARGLQKRGHLVKLAAPHRFADFAARYHIPFIPLVGNPEDISVLINNAGKNVFRMVNSMRAYIFSIVPEVSRASFEACQDAELIIHSFLFAVGMHSWALEHGIPDVSVLTFPVFAPTRAFPNVATAWLPKGVLSYFSHWFFHQVFWHIGNSGYKPAIHAHPDIPYPKKLYWPFGGSSPPPLRTPVLFAYSPVVLPRPREWGEDIHIPGYFFLDDETYQPPAALTDFLAEGKPPVCISFGSMVNRETERVTRALLEALARTENRAVFLTGWGGWKPEASPKNVLFIDAVPHDWLFPRCEAIVHHGGAGTTGAGLRAGIPNLVVPHTADQPFWGKRVHAIGAGPKPIAVWELTADRLASALTEAESQAIRVRSQAIGREIRREQGVECAVEVIEAHASRWGRPRIF